MPLPRPPPVRPAAADSAPEPADVGPEATAPAEDEAQEAGWKDALDRAVVDGEDLAYVLVRAGEYEKAAAVYGELSSLRPDSLHLPGMQALCLWNAGRRQEGLDLLKEAGLSKGEAGDWSKWMTEVLEMTNSGGRPDAAAAPGSPPKAGGEEK